jgi:hypothetical protein
VVQVPHWKSSVDLQADIDSRLRGVAAILATDDPLSDLSRYNAGVREGLSPEFYKILGQADGNPNAIGDGYEADEIAEVIRHHGYSVFFVETTHCMVAGEPRSGNTEWRVGVEGGPVVGLKNKALAIVEGDPTVSSANVVRVAVVGPTAVAAEVKGNQLIGGGPNESRSVPSGPVIWVTTSAFSAH